MVTSYWTGKTRSAETIAKIRATKLARPTKYWLGKKRPSPSIETRMKLSEALQGAKSYLWKGGVTPINNAMRKSVKYKIWREKVFKRDKYTCQECGATGCFLHADHIKPFAHYPRLRLKVSNGRTLCVPCHKATPTYGGRSKK